MSRVIRRWTVAFGCCCIIVVICVVFVDRPLADDSRLLFGGTDLFQWVVKIFRPMELAAEASFIVIAAVGFWMRIQHRDLENISLPIQCATASVAALLITLFLKVAVGRSQVYPSFIVSRIYEFHPFHGGTDYQGFPSATMAVTAALAGALWTRAPARRWLWVLITLLQAAALIITNSHWLGDIVGGVFVGAFVGWWIVHRADKVRPPSPTPI